MRLTLKSFKSWKGFCVVTAVAAGLLGHWKIFENDVFWQMRAGEELFHFQFTPFEHWSSTAYGERWWNFQWLSCIVFFLIGKIASGTLLPTLRAVLISIFTWQTLKLTEVSLQNERTRIRFSMVLVPLLLIVSYGRLQLRPDVFNEILFSVLLQMLWKPKTHPVGVFTVVWLAGAFHAGTAPILIGVVLAAIATGVWKLKRPLLWSSAYALSIFLNPYGWHILESILSITIHYDWTRIGNPDHSPITLGHLNPLGGGKIFIPWLTAVTIPWVCAFLGRVKSISTVQKRWIGMIGTALIVLTFARMRARVYSLVFFVPVLGFLYAELQNKLKKALPLTITASLGLAVLLAHHLRTGPSYGFGVNQFLFPVNSAAFIENMRPVGPMLNAFDFGGYLVQNLRRYPVAQDGREIPYQGFFAELAQARENPDRFQNFLSHRGFNFALIRNSAENDPYGLWYPQAEWARVFHDDASIVYVRRISAHQKIIQDHEEKN